MPSINMYTKEQIDAKIPATTSASAGDVLTLDSNKDAVWQAPSGGSGITKTTISNATDFINWLFNANLGDEFQSSYVNGGSSKELVYISCKVAKITSISSNVKNVYLTSTGRIKTTNSYMITYMYANVYSDSPANYSVLNAYYLNGTTETAVSITMSNISQINDGLGINFS